jgi:hypothetical protein
MIRDDIERCEGPNPTFSSQNTECPGEGCDQYGTALRPGIAEQRFLRILSTSRGAAFLRAESVVLFGCHLLVFNALYAVWHVNRQSLASEETLNDANALLEFAH